MTIRLKLILTNLIVFGIILIAVAAAVYNRTREAEMARIDSHLDTYAAGFITDFEDRWENNSFPDSSELEALTVRHLSDVRIALVNDSGRVIYRRGELPAAVIGLAAAAFNGKAVHRRIAIHHEPLRLAIRPVRTDDSISFVLLLAASTEEVENRLDDLTILLVVTLMGALLLSAVAVYYFTGRAFRPVTQMVEAAEEISAATLDHRLAVPSSRDEVGRLAESLNAMMARIEAAFQSQRRFVADASHELRTPLTVVYGELEFLKRQIVDGRPNESISTVLHEIDRLAHLVDQLLVLARLDASRLSTDRRPVRLDELLAETVRLLQTAAAERRVALRLQIDDVVEITGGPDQLKRAVLNVVDNAVKYTAEGTEVSISLRRDGSIGVIVVRDHGPGIDPTETERVFQRFYRSPRARQACDGSGLGLAIARELVEAHRGSVRVAASDSDGATVEIRLPLAGSDDAGTSPPV